MAGKIITVRTEDLRFDLENPRVLIDHGFQNENEVLEYLYINTDVNEVIQSILSVGFISDFEPLIVKKEGNDTYTVLEGNRRLAALRIISNETIQKELGVSLDAVPNLNSKPERINVLLVDDRNSARDFIAFKHINGPAKWDAMAKAKYSAQWLEDGNSIDVISKRIGDSHNTVRRLVFGWYALQQAIDNGFDLEDRTKKRFAFSHLYTALTRSGFREYLGLTDMDTSADPAENPIPTEKTKELLEVVGWLYGQEKKNEPALVRSQNPHLNQLNDVLAKPEARRVLASLRSLEKAYEEVEPRSGHLENALMQAIKHAEDALKYSDAFDGDPAQFEIAKRLSASARNIVSLMRDKIEGRDEGD